MRNFVLGTLVFELLLRLEGASQVSSYEDPALVRHPASLLVNSLMRSGNQVLKCCQIFHGQP